MIIKVLVPEKRDSRKGRKTKEEARIPEILEFKKIMSNASQKDIDLINNFNDINDFLSIDKNIISRIYQDLVKRWSYQTLVKI